MNGYIEQIINNKTDGNNIHPACMVLRVSPALSCLQRFLISALPSERESLVSAGFPQQTKTQNLISFLQTLQKTIWEDIRMSRYWDEEDHNP